MSATPACGARQAMPRRSHGTSAASYWTTGATGPVIVLLAPTRSTPTVFLASDLVVPHVRKFLLR